MKLLEGSQEENLTMCLWDQRAEDSEESRKAKSVIKLLLPDQLSKLIKAVVI